MKSTLHDLVETLNHSYNLGLSLRFDSDAFINEYSLIKKYIDKQMNRLYGIYFN